MRRLLLSGILYLIGVAVILAFKPAFMFREDGVWKEFGIGRNRETHTWFPFWLFVIVWAIVSYTIAYLVIPGMNSTMNSTMNPTTTVVEAPQLRQRGKNKRAAVMSEPEAAAAPPGKLTPGYYILNMEGSKDGVPKYIYLGEAPAPEPQQVL